MNPSGFTFDYLHVIASLRAYHVGLQNLVLLRLSLEILAGSAHLHIKWSIHP